MSKLVKEPNELFPYLKPIFWKMGRLDTFVHWPFESNKACNSENMARAGFYAIGGEEEPDLAACFICHKQLDEWEPDDDPWKEHAKHQPNCPFIKLGKPNELDFKVSELFQLIKEFFKNEINLEAEKELDIFKRFCKDSVEKIPEDYEILKKSQKKEEQ